MVVNRHCAQNVVVLVCVVAGCEVVPSSGRSTDPKSMTDRAKGKFLAGPTQMLPGIVISESAIATCAASAHAI